jgi:hypothetical protein
MRLETPVKRRNNATLFIALNLLWMPAMSAFSHEGHGAAGAHWHAGDAAMGLALAAVLGFAVWLSKGKK